MRAQALWAEHAAFMNALATDGFVVLGGPVGPGEEETGRLAGSPRRRSPERIGLARDRARRAVDYPSRWSFSRSVTKATVPAMQEESVMKIPAQPEMKFLGKFGGAIAGAVHMTRDTAWEMHPNGDECLHLLSGAVDVVTEEAPGGRVTELRAGGACVVLRGRWHRLVVREPGDLLFITPTLGTQHRDVVDPTQSKRDG